jgi:glycosyltransferase involved in cell wall biosynthesis
MIVDINTNFMDKSVLMFGWEYPPYFAGGLGVVTKSIISALNKNGVRINFVLPKIPESIEDKFAEFIDASKIEANSKLNNYFEIDSSLLPYHVFLQKILKDEFWVSNDIYGQNLFDEINQYSQKAVEISKVVPHNIIHAHDWMTVNAGVAAKRYSNKPLLVHVHATEFDRTGGNPNTDIYKLERFGFENSDRIVAVSNLTKEKIVDNYGISSDKIDVVHNAIDYYNDYKLPPPKLNKTDKIVLFLGRMTLQKGPKFLLEAAEKVIRNTKRVKFVFVGHGDMLREIIDKSIELGIQDKVMFTGFMSHYEVDRVYQMADLYVMPSVSEPFGISALEAIKNGTPVIISKQSGVSEVIQNALKVDFWDIDELANQILAIIRYIPLSRHITRTAQKELLNLTWGIQSRKIIDIYNKLI